MLLFLLLLLQDPVLLDLKKLITIEPGTIPVIISAPHGGSLPLTGIPERYGGDNVSQFTTVRDVNTDLLAQRLATALEKRLGGKPYIVIAHFSRKYVDANRPANGAFESAGAKPVYEAYHAALAKACKEVKAKHGAGLLIDVHGQAVQRDAIFRGTLNGKSTKLLTERFGPQAITGPLGFQGLLEARGYTMLPPAKSEEKETKFTGGYIVQTYGSHTAYGIDAIQMEFGGNYSNRNKLDQTSSDIAEVVVEYLKRYVMPEK